MEDKKTFQSKAKDTEGSKRKKKSHFYTSKEDKYEQKNVSRNTKNPKNSIAKGGNAIRGLKNKGNDCWLNSLIQCINPLNIVIPENTSDSDLVASALKSTLKKLNCDIKSPFYPQEILNVFRSHFGYEKVCYPKTHAKK